MNSLANRVRITRDFLAKRVFCDGMPIEFSIELTSRCNLQCVMCPRDDDAERGLGNMRFDTFRRIIDEASEYLEFTYLHLAGEPLLHPRFAQLIDYAAEKGVKTGLSSNGTVLSPRRAEALIESNLDTLIISIDGVDEQTYEKIRGPKSFNKVVRNTENFLRAKTAAGRGPFTVVQMICMRENQHQAKVFCERWRELGADAVRLKRFFNFAGNVENLGNGSNGGSEPAGVRPPCLLPWRQLAFYYDGTAVACCHDFLHESVLGNIHHQSLGELWNSPAMLELRRKHVAGRQSEVKICANCNQPKTGLPTVLGVTALNARTAKRTLIAMERYTQRLGLKSPY